MDRWLEEAHDENTDLPAGVKLKAIKEYNIPSDYQTSLDPAF